MPCDALENILAGLVQQIDLLDLSLDELLKMNTENKIEIRVKKNN